MRYAVNPRRTQDIYVNFLRTLLPRGCRIVDFHENVLGILLLGQEFKRPRTGAQIQHDSSI